MVTTAVPLNNTELKDRTLWFDGDSTIHSDNLLELIQTGCRTDGLFVDHITKDIKQFNSLVSADEQITIKEGTKPLDLSWNIPQEYKDLDVEDYVIERMFEQEQYLTAEQNEAREIRVSEELILYRELYLENVLRTIIYIINTLELKKVIWGVGRGSSVSSYVLYLIGAHDVDSVFYELDIKDFLRL